MSTELRAAGGLHLDLGLLYRFVDGDLLDAESSEAESHLDGCAACRKQYRLLLSQEDRITELLLDAAGSRRPRPGSAPAAPERSTTSRYPMMPVAVPSATPALALPPRRRPRHLGLIVAGIVVVALWGFLLTRWFGGAADDTTFHQLRLTTQRTIESLEGPAGIQSSGEVATIDYELGFFVQLSLVEAGQIAIFHRRADGRVELVVPARGEGAPRLEPNVTLRFPAGEQGLVDGTLGRRGTVIVIPFRRAPSRDLLLDTATWIESTGRERTTAAPGQPDWRESLLRRFPNARLLPYQVGDR